MHYNRKDDHLLYAEQLYHDNHEFDHLSFVHHSLPTCGVADVSLQTSWAGQSFNKPYYINAMTGGSKQGQITNQKLAQLAETHDLALALGSASITLRDETTLDSFRIARKEAPHAFLLANLGAEHSLKHVERVVEALEADAIQLHLNIAQELTMPEGARTFDSWLNNIQQIVTHYQKPVIIKEVGFGMSQDTIQQLIDAGVQTIDISGRGGTDFAAIETNRQTHHIFDEFQNFGQSTPVSLLESRPLQDNVEILASGGIQTPLHIVKALALGAKAAGISGILLHLLNRHTVDEVLNILNQWDEALTHWMTLLHAPTIQALTQTDIVLDKELAHWCEARQLPWKDLAHRSH